MNKYNRLCIPLSLLIALTAFAISAFGEGEYRPLKNGSYGDDVIAVKERLYDLGYFTNSTFNNRYTDDTVKRVKTFEENCGLPETGVMTPALQALLFSENAVSRSGAGAGENLPALPETAASAYRTLQNGNEGDDVLTLKQKLKSFGFFTAKAETGAFNDALESAVKAYQQANGLDITGVADAALQEAIFSSQKTAARTSGSAGASDLSPIGPDGQITLPDLNENGFLADADAAPFVYASRKEGHWYYITQNVSVEIIRYENSKPRLTWFETEIRCTPDSLPRAFLAPGSRADGHNYLTPVQLGKKYDMVFGITDDFYGWRWYNRKDGWKQGVIVRNGEIKADETQPASSTKWPYLEVLALFGDGSMKAFESDEYTAQEYIDMGAVDTFAFGPILVRDGQINEVLYNKSVARFTDEDPRMAMGCIEPCHYMVITAKGRTSDSRGVTMAWMAERFQAMGCTDAINLDGGGTAALYFMGDVVNKAENSQNLRDISSMFGFAAQ